ncbi:MAG TPA: glycosyltransferase family 4 protein, partial [Verrucomicrobiae bacterium]|nr:glycosyltransferase family 4 protein [Verrucomicrobiae bacterium]
LRQVLARGSFDAVLATTWFPHAAAVTATRSRAPLYLCVYGNDFLERRWEKPFWRKRLFRALEQSRLLLAGSVGSAEAIREFWPAAAAKTVVVTPAVDPAEFGPGAASPPPDQPVLLTLARLVERKGQDMVIRALPTILKEFPRAEYWIAGRGSHEEALRRLARETGVESRVKFLGFVSREERISLYQRCTLYLMPSRTIAEKGDFEAFGITFLEANACGKPVIGGRSGGIADAVIDGVTGLLADPHSPGDIAWQTLRILRDSGYARKLGDQGRRRVETEMNWASTAKRVVELFSKPAGK